MNAVEREPVQTRVLNPNASEASYKTKQRSYRTTNIKKKVLAPNSPGAEMSSAETAALSRRRRNVPDPIILTTLYPGYFTTTTIFRHFSSPPYLQVYNTLKQGNIGVHIF